MIAPAVNTARLKHDLSLPWDDRFAEYWKEKYFHFIPRELFTAGKPVWLEIGAGSGAFFIELAKLNQDTQLIAVERSRMRGKRLLHRTQRAGVENLASFRGNAIPALLHGVPTESVDRIYILYPPPWPRNSQRKNRWYIHPIMPHLIRVLKPGGVLIWASDQKFYIEEAKFVCEHLGIQTRVHGAIAPNEWNDLHLFPQGRSKFEASFLAIGQPCFELISQKASCL